METPYFRYHEFISNYSGRWGFHLHWQRKIANLNHGILLLSITRNNIELFWPLTLMHHSVYFYSMWTIFPFSIKKFKYVMHISKIKIKRFFSKISMYIFCILVCCDFKHEILFDTPIWQLFSSLVLGQILSEILPYFQ